MAFEREEELSSVLAQRHRVPPPWQQDRWVRVKPAWKVSLRRMDDSPYRPNRAKRNIFGIVLFREIS
jgi:hypothetical protein